MEKQKSERDAILKFFTKWYTISNALLEKYNKMILLALKYF